jgi:hypothetical protein
MYVYQAELFCDDCGEAIAANRRAAGVVDEGDSDGFPQQVASGETDSPNHCAAGHDCLEAVDLYDYGLKPGDELEGSEQSLIGALLPETLTADGLTYAYELATEQDPTPYQRAVHRLWRETYDGIGELIEESARARGLEDGKAAGSWVIDGNTTEHTARAILQGLEEGDPETLDGLPSGPLSGEYADGLLPRDVLGWYGLLEDDAEADDVLRAYEDGWSEGMVDEAERSARAVLPQPEPEPEQQGYNGWANYPTWSVHLWLTNEQPLYEETLELVSQPVDLLGSESGLVYIDEERRQGYAAAERLKSFVRDLIDLDEASLRADLVGYALDEVDWREIADALLEGSES